ncbi:MAG TPA: response regulator [Planctomycetaceae bacterium]|nr:response regulator [Planctomycetaceae bacterium]
MLVGKDSASRRVLVVDDDPDVVHAVTLTLRLLGHQVASAHDGLEALDLFPRFQPDAAILDLCLPELDGFELARRIRDLPGGTALLLVALSGLCDGEHRQRSAEAGFDHHLAKPANLRELAELIATG